MSLQEQSTGALDTVASTQALEGNNGANSEQALEGASQEEKPMSIPVMRTESAVDDMRGKDDNSHGEPGNAQHQDAPKTDLTAERSIAGPEAKLQMLSLSSTPQPAATNDATKQEGSQHVQPGALAAESKVESYLDPTPKTPRLGVSPSRGPHNEAKGADEGNQNSEIQSIMDQFGEGDEIEEEENPWAGLNSDLQTQLTAPIQHPPRGSSLISAGPVSPPPLNDSMTEDTSYATGPTDAQDERLRTPVKGHEVTRPNRISSLPQAARIVAIQDTVPPSPGSPVSLSKVPPPAPDPEPDLPFDFHRFLEQLRHKSADPVAKYLRSFLIEFGRKQWMVHEQVKLVNDFLAFITNKMARCEVWRDANDAEFDNAKEGMEKLVMNRLYAQTFSPAIPPTPAPTPKGKKKTAEKMVEPGRRGQHQEDIERDEILGQKVRIYGWIQEEHLDIPRVSDSGRRFLVLAQQELLKIKTYRAPRDKVICVLNCCKVIFGILRNSKTSDTSADSFVPLLIYVVLHANPEHLVSNVQYILRFRNQDKLGGEAGYYLSSLMGAIQFIENLDRTSLTVSDDEFEKNVEAAVSAIAERHQEELSPPTIPPQRPQPPRVPTHGQISEKSGPSLPEVIPRNSIEAEYSTPRKSPSLRGRQGEFTDGVEDNTAVSGLLRTIQKPLSSIGRMFSDDPGPGPQRLPPESQPHPRLSPAVFQPPRHSDEMDGSTERPQQAQAPQVPPITGESQNRKLSAEDAAARQASAEAAEAQRIQRAEHHNVVE